tara:strand:- start:588 stop:908 length:321 start_codon:yes stop_codon:yes gene_type:complete
VYAIKVYLRRPKKSGLATKDGYFMETALQRDYYLLRDLDTFAVHIWTRKEKALAIAEHLQKESPNSLIMITDDIPKAALERALKYKQAKQNESNQNKENEPSGKGG